MFMRVMTNPPPSFNAVLAFGTRCYIEKGVEHMHIELSINNIKLEVHSCHLALSSHYLSYLETALGVPVPYLIHSRNRYSSGMAQETYAIRTPIVPRSGIAAVHFPAVSWRED
eukprot:Gb_21230 [translate_table: standard]